MDELRWIFLGREGRLRSGWAILVYAGGLAGGTGLLALTSGSLPAGLTSSWALLLVSLFATVVGCLVVRQSIGAAGFRDRRWWSRLLFGFVLGAAVVALLVGVPWAFGREGLAGPAGSARALVIAGSHQMAFFAPPSMGEEVLLRGFVLQQLTRGTRRWLAVVITGSVFGVLHLRNPNVIWLGIVNIVLAGLWLGLLVVRSGSLWLSIGAHISWNWFEGFVFGQAVSGTSPGDTLLHETHGSSIFWTGGPFGPEASGVCTMVLVLAILASVSWKREPKTAEVV